MNMTAAEFRRAHLARYIEECGTANAFAIKVGLSPSYVSQLVKGVPGGREIGTKTARKIEKAMGETAGAMDLPPETSTQARLVELMSSLPEEKWISAVTSSVPQLSPEGLRTLLAACLSRPADSTSPKE